MELSAIEQTVPALPPDAQKELQHFVSYLQYKYRTDQPAQVVKLGGLWVNIGLDVSDKAVRALRQQKTNHRQEDHNG